MNKGTTITQDSLEAAQVKKLSIKNIKTFHYKALAA